MTGKQVNDEFSVVVPPSLGYGERQESLMTKVTRQELGGIEDLDLGVQLQAHTNEGLQVFTVVGLDGDEVTLDGNHPLAGQQLHFEIRIASVREASAEEIAHGHVHGPGGAHH